METSVVCDVVRSLRKRKLIKGISLLDNQSKWKNKLRNILVGRRRRLLDSEKEIKRLNRRLSKLELCNKELLRMNDAMKESYQPFEHGTRVRKYGSKNGT